MWWHFRLCLLCLWCISWWVMKCSPLFISSFNIFTILETDPKYLFRRTERFALFCCPCGSDHSHRAHKRTDGLWKSLDERKNDIWTWRFGRDLLFCAQWFFDNLFAFAGKKRNRNNSRKKVLFATDIKDLASVLSCGFGGISGSASFAFYGPSIS